jgi:cytochrome b561
MSTNQYSTPTKFFHWLTAILVLIAFIYGPGGPEERIYAAARDFERQLHETLGLCVLFISVMRLLWRTFDTRPESEPALPWMQRSSTLVQVSLFALLFAVPFTAILGSWFEGHPLTLLGSLEIHPLVSEFHTLGSIIAEIHTWLGDIILWLAGAHAAAALFHHYILGDRVLISMLPKRFSKL